MKDNFNLRKFLIENKLTETGRKNRYKFNKPVNLYEMEMPVDGYDDEDDTLGLNMPVGDYEAEGPLGVDPNDDFGLEEAYRDNLDHPERDALYRELSGYQSKYGNDKGMKIFVKFHPELPDAELNRIIPHYAKKNKEIGNAQDQARLNRMSLGQETATRDDLRDPKTGRALIDPRKLSGDEPEYDKYGNRTGVVMHGPKAIDEAGYIDDENDYEGGDDLDFSAGDSLVNALSGGKESI